MMTQGESFDSTMAGSEDFDKLQVEEPWLLDDVHARVLWPTYRHALWLVPVWRLAHLEEYRPRRSGRLAVASAIGLAGYVVCLLGIFHAALGMTGLDAGMGEAVCLVLPILSMTIAIRLARAQRFRDEAAEDRYSEELGKIIKEELEMDIESGQAAWEEHREDCAGLGYDPTAL
jgi:hypothetical protein